MSQKKDKKEPDKTQVIQSALTVKESKESQERTRADLDIKDPSPEKCEAALQKLRGGS